MVTAISPALAAATTPAHDSESSWSQTCFFKMPNLRDEVKRQVSQASAWAAWHGIFDALNDQRMRGRNEEIRLNAERGVVGVGIHAIARALGVSKSTVRRQLNKLETIGLVSIFSPQLIDVRDKATGRIVKKSKGRTPPVIVYVTVTDQHLRPFRKGAQCAQAGRVAGGRKGAQCAQRVGDLKAHNAPPSKEPNTTKERQPNPTCGMGVGLPNQTRRHSAAKAYQEDAREPAAFTGAAADAFEWTRRKLAAEKAARERHNPPTQYAPQHRRADPGEDLAKAVESLPPDKRQRCHDLGEDAADVADAADADEALILDAIMRRKAAEESARAAEAKGRKEAYRDQYHREIAAQAS
jgi:hypothetical protein